jgi:hypothetical protein
MSRCYPSAVVGVCCGRPGLRSRLQPLERWTAASGSRGPSSFSSFHPGTALEPLDWVALVCGAECHARPSAALAHLSARAKSVGTVSTSCVANFSNIFSSRTPCRKAVMMEASENTWYSTSHLGEVGDELSEGLSGLLPHRMEVGLHTVLLVSTGKVRNEPRVELLPGVD